jgi:urea transporter
MFGGIAGLLSNQAVMAAMTVAIAIGLGHVVAQKLKRMIGAYDHSDTDGVIGYDDPNDGST